MTLLETALRLLAKSTKRGMVVEVVIAAKGVMTGVKGVIAVKAAMTGAIAVIAVKAVMTGAIAVMTAVIAVRAK
jgi:hypothetical protein